MKPTLTFIHTTDNSVAIVFECDHAKTGAELLDDDGEALHSFAQYVLARHGETCQCTPEAFEDCWQSLAHMRADVERGLASASAATVDPGVLALGHQQLDSMSRHDCTCDPHVRAAFTLGVVEFGWTHREGCEREPRTACETRWMDFSTPGMPA